MKYNGALAGYVYVPVFVTPKESTKPVAAAVAGVGSADSDIVWTSTNKSLAKVIDFIPKDNVAAIVESELRNKEENDIAKNATSCYGVAKIEVAGNTATNKFTGIVTIKGTLKNSNKVVSIKINVRTGEVTRNETADNFATPYNPQTVTLAANAAEATPPTLANIVKAAKANDTSSPLISGVSVADDLAKLQSIAKTKKTASGKKITAWQYVLVNDTTVSAINKDINKKAFLMDTLTVSQGDKPAVTALKPGATAPAAGTYYLALAQVDYEVDKAYSAKTDDKDEQIATFKAPVIKKVTAIASKTPMINTLPQA